MIFWIDENVPYQVAKWINKDTNHKGYSFTELGLKTTSDKEIFFKAKYEAEKLPESEKLAIITKDHDFVELLSLYAAPPGVVLILLHNTGRNELITVLNEHLPGIVKRIERGDQLVYVE